VRISTRKTHKMCITGLLSQTSPPFEPCHIVDCTSVLRFRYMSFAYRCYPLPEWGLLLRDAVGALIFQAQREMAFERKQEQTLGNAPTASLLDLSSSSIVLEEDMLSALLLMQDSGSAEMSSLRQMQNSFAGELSLQ